jgi:hypothetical protein
VSKFWCKKDNFSLCVDEGQSEYVSGKGMLLVRPPKWVDFHNHVYSTDDPALIAKFKAISKAKPGFIVLADEDGFKAPLDETQWLTHKAACALGFSFGELKSLAESGRVRTQEDDKKKTCYSHYDLSEALQEKAGSSTDKGL